MRSIIAEGGGARSRLDRVAAATCDQLKMALIALSDFSPDAFDYAMDEAESADDSFSSHEAVPVCAVCGESVGIFVGLGLDWRHFAGDGATAGQQRVYDAGHAPVVTWQPAGELHV